jgi:hypothetical protein
MPINLINHKDRDILYINHRGLSGDALYESIKEANTFLLKEKKEYLTIADFTDSTATKKTNDYLQSDETKEVSKYISKQAVIGLTGIKKMMLRVYNVFTGLNLKAVNTLEEAKEYVTKL